MAQLAHSHRSRIIVVLTALLLMATCWFYMFSKGSLTQWQYLSFSSINDLEWKVMTQIRLPRLLMATINGLTLAVAGAITQAIFKNPLAAPTLIGISSGASLFGAATIMLTGAASMAFVQQLSVPLSAFVGGVLTCFLVFRLSWIEGRSNITILILAGIAINAVTGACLGLLLYMADDDVLRSIVFWTLGSIGAQKWSTVILNLAIMTIVVYGALKMSKALNSIALGEDLARHLGHPVERIKIISIVLVALGVGTSVAFCGVIGFVGLIVPHMSRMIFGAEIKQTILGCCTLGPCLMLLADYVSKSIVFPAELPIGIVTSAIGGPFFVYLLLRLKHKGSTL